MTDRDTLIRDTAVRIFEDHAGNGDGTALWQALADNGLSRCWASEDANGFGAELRDGYDLARVSGQFAARAPLTETLLSARLFDLAGRVVPDGRITIAPVRSGDLAEVQASGEVTFSARAVPYASASDWMLVATHQSRYVLIRSDKVRTTPRANDTGGDRFDVEGEGVAVEDAFEVAPSLPGVSRLEVEGAVVRALEMAGALETMLKLTVDYAGDRKAFGRSISKFQAVQQQLAQMAGEVAAALTAAGSAADALASGLDDPDGVLLEVGAAKVRVAEAATLGIAIAHQVHGAIGVTNEYALQRYSRSLIGWREDFGPAAIWAERLGRRVAARGGHQLWPFLTTR